MADVTAYLVIRQENGYGSYLELTPNKTFLLGRDRGCDFRLHNEGHCSRSHAEFQHRSGQWYVRDLASRNGTFHNGKRVENEVALTPGDELTIGKTCLIFVRKLAELPNLLEYDFGIKKRVSMKSSSPKQSRSRSNSSWSDSSGSDHGYNQLAKLYYVALDMLAAESVPQSLEVVLLALLEMTQADVAAVLTRDDSRTLTVAAHRCRGEAGEYLPPPGTIVGEVDTSGDALLAVSAARHHSLRNPQAQQDLECTSLICVPIAVGDKNEGMVHLYCTGLERVLSESDLEFAIETAEVVAVVLPRLRRSPASSHSGQAVLKSAEWKAGPTVLSSVDEARQRSSSTAPLETPVPDEELAKGELRRIMRALEEHRWKIGKASEALFGYRERLTRTVTNLLKNFPNLRLEPEFRRLVDEFAS